ncbi:hypothetical protein [Streptomyces olivochromogenes]|nr:hypothetical protein [Streptomyces olivochromogenes]
MRFAGPAVAHMVKLQEELTGLLPDLAALARATAREDEADNA